MTTETETTYWRGPDGSLNSVTALDRVEPPQHAVELTEAEFQAGMTQFRIARES